MALGVADHVVGAKALGNLMLEPLIFLAQLIQLLLGGLPQGAACATI